MYTCSKKFPDFPFAHRQPEHSGHCRLIHGHNWTFDFTFAARTLDPKTGFVLDFGDLLWLKVWLTGNFDHTLVLNIADPALEYLRACLTGAKACGVEAVLAPFAKIVCVPNCSSEGLAYFLFEEVDRMLRSRYKERGVHLIAVTVLEDSKNRAAYTLLPGGCNHG